MSGLDAVAATAVANARRAWPASSATTRRRGARGRRTTGCARRSPPSTAAPVEPERHAQGVDLEQAGGAGQAERRVEQVDQRRPAPMARPVVKAPRSTARCSSSDTGPGCAPTKRPRPKPISSALRRSPLGRDARELALAAARRGARPTGRPPRPSRPRPPTSARGWAGRAPRGRRDAPSHEAGGRQRAEVLLHRLAGHRQVDARARWHWPRRARPAGPADRGGCRPRARRRRRRSAAIRRTSISGGRAWGRAGHDLGAVRSSSASGRDSVDPHAGAVASVLEVELHAASTSSPGALHQNTSAAGSSTSSTQPLRSPGRHVAAGTQLDARRPRPASPVSVSERHTSRVRRGR